MASSPSIFNLSASFSQSLLDTQLPAVAFRSASIISGLQPSIIPRSLIIFNNLCSLRSKCSPNFALSFSINSLEKYPLGIMQSSWFIIDIATCICSGLKETDLPPSSTIYSFFNNIFSNISAHFLYLSLNFSYNALPMYTALTIPANDRRPIVPPIRLVHQSPS